MKIQFAHQKPGK